MRVKLIFSVSDWKRVADACRTTIGKDVGAGEPSTEWKRRLLLSEHSPIRKLTFNWKWEDLKSWVSVHFVRHKYGIEHWVSTQRTDRTGVNRDESTQDALVMHECEANAQAVINISRKRLCRLASHETQEAWTRVLLEIRDVNPELFAVCVPDCIYRGHCYEFNSCGWHKSEEFKRRLRWYRCDINE